MSLTQSTQSIMKTTEKTAVKRPPLHPKRFNPTTEEILQIERHEEFDKFYRRIKPQHIENIDIKKEIDNYVQQKIQRHSKLAGINMIASKLTQSVKIRSKFPCSSVYRGKEFSALSLIN